MRPVVLDFESYFSDDFTLSKMSTEAYIRDQRFIAHGAAIKWSPDHAAKWYDERQLREVLKNEDWSDVFLICHHTAFDGLILSHHYNVHPKMLGCTLSMARLLIGNHLSVSLDSVRQHFSMPAKRTPYNLFKGKRWHEMDVATQTLIGEGAEDEVESIWTLAQRFFAEVPAEELEVISTTLKMFTEPVLRADVDMLVKVWEDEARNKLERMARLDVLDKDLQSAAKFQQLLEAEGVEIEYKEGTNGPIPAFAKNDDFMRTLLESEDDRIKSLAEARIGAKSTALQTRAETFGFMAQRGNLCLYLNYCGAHTRRWSGGDSANPQNLKRIDKKNWKPNIRDAILPPEGFHMVDPDLSQVECRILSYLAGQEDALEEFRRGEDPYIKLASEAYGYEVTKAMPTERGTGKQLKLSCGFQAGAQTIQRTARLGIYGPPVYIDLDTAERWKKVYRDANPRVVDYWKTAGRMLTRIAGGPPLEWGPMTIRDGRVYLPNGMFLNYETLEFYKPEDGSEGFWRFKGRKGRNVVWTKTYSGRLVENVVQFIARCVASQAFVRIARLGYRIVNTEHDKHWILIPKDGQEAQHVQQIEQEMIRVPDWLPGLPLACECEVPQ